MEMLRTLTLRVELFAGTDVRDAAIDLCELANRIGVLCEAEFNGVTLWARAGDDPGLLVEDFHKQMSLPEQRFRIARAR